MSKAKNKIFFFDDERTSTLYASLLRYINELIHGQVIDEENFQITKKKIYSRMLQSYRY